MIPIHNDSVLIHIPCDDLLGRFTPVDGVRGFPAPVEGNPSLAQEARETEP